MVSSVRETRWEVFRREHRRRPVKKSLQAAIVLIALSSYLYMFFYCQSDRSYETIKAWNEVLEMKEKEEKKLLAEERKSNLRRGNYLDEEIGNVTPDGQIHLLHKEEASTSTSAPTTLRSKRQTQEEESDSFLRTMFFFFMLRIYLRICLARQNDNSNGGRTLSWNEDSDDEEDTDGDDDEQTHDERIRSWGEQLNSDREFLGLPSLRLSTIQRFMQGREPNQTSYVQLLQHQEDQQSNDDQIVDDG